MNKLLELIIGTAYAQDMIPCEDGSMADPSIGCVTAPTAIVDSESSLLSIIMKSADAIVSIVVVLAVITLIYGGIIYMMGLGSENKINKAKKILFWGTFGLVLGLLAKYIVSTVLLLISQ